MLVQDMGFDNMAVWEMMQKLTMANFLILL